MAQRLYGVRATNKPGYDLYDYRIYVLCGDGDMMEGVSSETASVAGHLKLSNLVWVYDSNHITIEGSTNLAFSEDVGARFTAYGWKRGASGGCERYDRVDGRSAGSGDGARQADADRPCIA